jgi:hypothetical protein
MTSLTLVRRIRARPSIVFEALITPDGIAQWWGPDAGPVLFAETEITFTHARLRTETSRASHEQGWTGALDKLERRFAHG